MATGTRVTESQKEVLVACMEQNPEMHRQRFSATFTKEKSEKLWADLAHTLNAMGGAQKICIAWKKTWADLKRKVREIFAVAAAHVNGTGGGSPLEINLNGIQKRIAILIGEVPTQGDPMTFEVGFGNIEGIADDDSIDSGNSAPVGEAISMASTSTFKPTSCMSVGAPSTQLPSNEMPSIKCQSIPSCSSTSTFARKKSKSG